MSLTKNKTMIITGLVLFVAFLIESPLYTSVVALFSFAPAIAHLIVGVIAYVAMLVCVLVATKQYLSKSNFLKALGIVVAFAVVDRVISMFLVIEIIALFYQIIRPIIAVAFILLAVKVISKSRLEKVLKLIVAGIVVFVVNIVSNVLEFMRMIEVMQNMQNTQNDFFAYLSLLTPSNSIYSIVASLCGYVLIFIAFVIAEKSVSRDM